MKKFIPGEKLSKKTQHELNGHMRKTWGTLNPVTRAPADPKVYNRKKLRKDDYDSSPELFLLFSLSIPIPLYKLQNQHEPSNNERIPCRIMSSRCRERHFTQTTGGTMELDRTVILSGKKLWKDGYNLLQKLFASRLVGIICRLFLLVFLFAADKLNREVYRDGEHTKNDCNDYHGFNRRIGRIIYIGHDIVFGCVCECVIVFGAVEYKIFG